MPETSLDCFLLTRQWRDGPAGLELSFWGRSESGPVRVIVEGESAVAFIPREAALPSPLGEDSNITRRPLALRDLAGGAVDGLYFRFQRALNDARNRPAPARRAGLRIGPEAERPLPDGALRDLGLQRSGGSARAGRSPRIPKPRDHARFIPAPSRVRGHRHRDLGLRRRALLDRGVRGAPAPRVHGQRRPRSTPPISSWSAAATSAKPCGASSTG